MNNQKSFCVVCGKETKNIKRLCCSRGCANTYRASKIKRPNCDYCGNIVNRRLSHCREKVYCNKKCETDSKKRRITLICKICKNSYERKFSQKSSKYCSRKCMGKDKDFVSGKSPQYRSFGECAMVCLFRKNYADLKIITSDRKELSGYEMDIWIPELKVGIEYNGQHHFKPVYGEDRFKKTQIADKNKSDIAKNKGINLFYIKPNGSVSYTSKTKITNMFVECCREIGLTPPTILNFTTEEVKLEQGGCKPPGEYRR